ncbi:MAG: SpoIIE family protein phosphatase [Phycisphaerales bacterium]|nr:MAG: SpoIIE family protein phosphatase [Phycisphaerales bacterium]
MAKATLAIYGYGDARRVDLNPKGTIVGRSPRCDVVVESSDISRQHVRIFQDPFGRWVVEDLGSSNGTFINGKRIETSTILHGEPVVVGPVSLSITQSLDQRIERDDSAQGTNVVVENFGTEVFYGERKQHDAPARPCPREFDEITRRLSALTSASALYPEVCRFVARAPKTVAIVLRLPDKSQPVPKSPEIIACHFGHSPDDTAAGDVVGYYPSRLAFRVSGHVLEKVRSEGHAVMAKSIYSPDEEVTSTFVDAHSPRAVICMPLGDVEEEVDLLYLDIPIEDRTRTRPEEIFEFLHVISQDIISTRKRLVLMEAKAEANALDHELSLARQIQSKLAPAVPPNLSGFDLGLLYDPATWVGGDYCDVWVLSDGRLAFAVGDLHSKGLPAAMAMVGLRTVLRTVTSFCAEPSEVIKHVASHLAQNSPEKVSATLFFGLLDTSEGTIEYVNAGHPQPIVFGPQTAPTPLGKSSDVALGADNATFQTKAGTIKQRAGLLVFTDGITETKSPQGEEFGVKRLAHSLGASGKQRADEVVKSIGRSVAEFRQVLAQNDDISAIALVNRG